MKSFAELMVEAEGFQGKFTPDHDTKKQAIELGKKVNPKPKPGGALALRPADKGTSIIKSKQARTDGPGEKPDRKTSPSPKVSNSVNQTTARAGKGGPITRYKAPEEPEKQEKPPKKDDDKKKGPSMMQRFGNFAKKGLNNTVGDGPPESSSGSIDAPKRGVYNG